MTEKCKHAAAHRIETELGTMYKCLNCGKDITHWTRKCWNFIWVKRRVYQSRGEIYIADLNGLYTMIGGGAFGIVIYRGLVEGSWAKFWIMPLIWFLQKLFVYWLGWKDYTKWKNAQKESTLAGSLAPITVETLRILNQLRDKMCPELRAPSILDYYTKAENNN